MGRVELANRTSYCGVHDALQAAALARRMDNTHVGAVGTVGPADVPADIGLGDEVFQAG